MNPRSLDRFIGVPYDDETMDCADLALHIQAELFGRVIRAPGRPVRKAAPQAVLSRYVCGSSTMSGELAEPISAEQAQDGDVLIMRSGGFLHIGTVFLINGAQWVLHTFEDVGFSTLHRFSELRDLGLRAEGFYRWK